MAGFWSWLDRWGLAIAFVAIWALGTLGWRWTDPSLDWPEAIYRALQLFSLNFEQTADINIWLQLARFLAPAFLIYTLIIAFSRHLGMWMWAISKLFRRRITVVGFGSVGKAAAQRLRERHKRARIVAIDRTVAPADRRAADNAGVKLIEVDALDAVGRDRFPVSLRRSDDIVIACGPDDITLAIAEDIRSDLRSRGETDTNIWMHLGSHSLAERLRDADTATDPPRAEPFELATTTARALMMEHPLSLEARAAELKRVHVVIHGFGEFGWVMAEEVLLNGGFPAPTFKPPLVSVVVANSAEAKARWLARHHTEHDVPEVEFFDAPKGTLGTDDTALEPLDEIEKLAPPSLHVIAMGDDTVSIAEGLALRAAMRRGKRITAPIAIFTETRSHRPFDLAKPSGVRQHSLMMVGDALGASGQASFVDSEIETLARTIQKGYHDKWGGPEFKKEPFTMQLSNRRAAAHFLHKLRVLGFERLDPQAIAFGIGDSGLGWLESLPETKLLEIDRFEHERWRVDRVLEGWRPGKRNDEARLRHQLVPGWFAALAPNATDGKDRAQMAAFLKDGRKRLRGAMLTLPWGSIKLPWGWKKTRAKYPRTVDRVWEGALPVWTVGKKSLKLAFAEPVDWSAFASADGEEVRLRILLPKQPPLRLKDPADDKDKDESWELRLELMRQALADFAGQILDPRQRTGISQVRFLRCADGSWDWLARDAGDRIDGITLPHLRIGFAGHIDLARLGDVEAVKARLRDEVAALAPEDRISLMTGLAPGSDQLMIDVWPTRETVTGVYPFAVNGKPASDDRDTAVIPDALAARVGTLAGPIGSHDALGKAILDWANLLIVVSDGNANGDGGTENLVEQARARGMLVRYIKVPL
ncbi:hypothetical protein P1X14_21800 [Sphingomonas sp. AOB5]|uniref:saccharopine dehydrogenase NADP-binding domain-containing protein n=1 Tax=Sphingomonas sp. AOB5 TaxID=3034017 RepID=UPI0023F87201|nr:saccharopine dehydrogenase NADP-binding domain-containing protein [Sphingomonas sp. AOB5]MDF7777905.1 hypothetical protein [Sphingomonas sp. AOB5]